MTRQPKADRKIQVYETITQIIAEEGIGAVSTSTVAKALKVSQPALYRYFANRDEMLLGYLDHLSGMLMGMLEIIRQQPTCRARIESFYRAQFEIIERTRILPKILFFEEFHLDRGLKKARLRKMVEDYEEGILGVIEEGMDSGEMKRLDPRVTMQFIKGAVLTVYLEWVLGGETRPLVDEVEGLMGFLDGVVFLG